MCDARPHQACAQDANFFNVDFFDAFWALRAFFKSNESCSFSSLTAASSISASDSCERSDVIVALAASRDDAVVLLPVLARAAAAVAASALSSIIFRAENLILMSLGLMLATRRFG